MVAHGSRRFVLSIDTVTSREIDRNGREYKVQCVASFFLGRHLDELENRSTKESHVHLK